MNTTTRPEDDDRDRFRCWTRLDCGGCLGEVGCSWCPFSWSCVPNAYSVPFLAPAYDENICTLPRERWEIRTRPLGCQVSTITSLTSIVSIVSTIVFFLLIFLVVFAVRGLRRLDRTWPEWRKAWRIQWDSWSPTTWSRRRNRPESRPGTPEEQAPLLAA